MCQNLLASHEFPYAILLLVSSVLFTNESLAPARRLVFLDFAFVPTADRASRPGSFPRPSLELAERLAGEGSGEGNPVSVILCFEFVSDLFRSLSRNFGFSAWNFLKRVFVSFVLTPYAQTPKNQPFLKLAYRRNKDIFGQINYPRIRAIRPDFDISNTFFSGFAEAAGTIKIDTDEAV